MKCFTRALIILLAGALILTGCTAVPEGGQDEAAAAPEAAVPAGDSIVAKVGEREITRATFAVEFENMLRFYSYYGMEAPTDEEEINIAQDMVLDSLINTELLIHQAELMGILPLTGEDAAAAEELYQAEVKNLIDSFKEQAASEGAEDTEAAAIEKINAALAEQSPDMDYESYLVWLKKAMDENYALEKLEERVKEGITAGAEKAREYYDTLLSEQTVRYETDRASFATESEEYDLFGGVPVLTAPEGFVRVRVLRIAPSEQPGADYTEKQKELTTLEAEYGRLALVDATGNLSRLKDIEKQYGELNDELDFMKTTYLAGSKALAEKAEKELAEGRDFLELLKEYGTDTSYATSETVAQKGRLLDLTDTADGWDAIVHETVEKLADGELSKLVAGENAFYIVERVGLEPAGAVAFDEVSDVISELASAEEKENAWTEKQEAWTVDRENVTIFEENYRDVGKAVG